ncbi:ABC-three component system middle component 1 [Enterococcus casseliflavus]|uniref:ABC-three component system middle component 1 n=1 Tax=Enterococcus casseliflavus TaxID=37734 RepID=UPI0023D885D8|nr:ABC-three component system middle component 1 [Enterococcus casseliflavus]WEI92482.1 hypothetical protein PZY29_00585 [Enterococcus casseliflavus]
MKEVIDAIFLNNGFKNIPIINPFSDTVSFWGNYSKKSTNFYLIVYTDEINPDFIAKRVPEYFNAIKTIEKGYDERIDKNLSMLICLRNNSAESLTKQKNIFEIEEDPYFFKKYLLLYNKDIESIKKEILRGEDINDAINNIVNDTEKFNKYKLGLDTPEVRLYELCSKLITKIPFISLKHKQSNLNDLSKTIGNCLEKKGLKENRNKILQHFELEDEEFICRIVDNIDLENINYD